MDASALSVYLSRPANWNTYIDGDDVGHRGESSQTGANFAKGCRATNLLGLDLLVIVFNGRPPCTYMSATAEVKEVTEAGGGDPFVGQIAKIA